MIRLKQTVLMPLFAFIALLVFGVLSDKFINEYYQLLFLLAGANVILALSLNLVSGFTGQFSLGHAGFMAIGAYVAAYLSMRPDLGGSNFYCFPLYAIAGGLAAAVAGWLVGQPTLRLRGDYLAIVTLGFSEIIRVIFLNSQTLGGARGMFNVPGPSKLDLGPIVIDHYMSNFFWSAFWIIVTFVVLWRVVRSTHGRGFLSVREDEIAAEAMGINTTRMKVRAFVMSSFFAGIAGALFVSASHYVSPASFDFKRSVDVVIMVVLGGMGSFSGSVIAALFVTFFPEILRKLQDYTHVDFRMVIYAASLVLLMILRPQGLFGTREIGDLIPADWFGREKKSGAPDGLA